MSTTYCLLDPKKTDEYDFTDICIEESMSEEFYNASNSSKIPQLIAQAYIKFNALAHDYPNSKIYLAISNNADSNQSTIEIDCFVSDGPDLDI